MQLRDEIHRRLWWKQVGILAPQKIVEPRLEAATAHVLQHNAGIRPPRQRMNEEPCQPVGEIAAKQQESLPAEEIVQPLRRILLVDQRPTELDQLILRGGKSIGVAAGGTEQMENHGWLAWNEVMGQVVVE
jgi:hypothetical protein